MRAPMVVVGIVAASLGCATAPETASNSQALVDLFDNGAARVVSVTGRASERVPFEHAQVTVAVQSEGDSADAAWKACEGTLQATQTAIEAGGIPAGEIDVFPPQVHRPFAMPGEVKRTIVSARDSFRVAVALNFPVRDLARLRPLLQAITGAGAKADVVWLVPADEAAARARLRERAFEDARAQASKLAEMAGAQLGQVRRMSVATEPSTARESFSGPLLESPTVPIVAPRRELVEVIVVDFALR